MEIDQKRGAIGLRQEHCLRVELTPTDLRVQGSICLKVTDPVSAPAVGGDDVGCVVFAFKEPDNVLPVDDSDVGLDLVECSTE